MTPIRSTDSTLRSRALTALTTTAALLALAACGDGSETPSSPGGTTLSIAVHGAPNSFDPSQTAEGQQAYVWSSVYDTLLATDNKGRLQPNAAESWKYSDNGLTLTLKLRGGMKFSSGSAVNSAAVKATLERTKSRPGPHQGKLASIRSVQAPDDLTVVIELKRPDASLLSSFTMAVGVIGDPATMDQQRTALDPVGSGPYVLDKDATVNGSTYVLERRDDYWNVKAYPFKTVKVRVLEDPTAALNALQAGEINAASVQVQQVPKIKAAGFDITFVPATAIGNLILADREGQVLEPLADQRVRQAINMAFDRQKIVKQLLRGAGKATEQLFNPKGQAYDAGLEQTYPYAPAAAKELMAEAGYPSGFSVTVPSLAFSKPFEPTVTQSLSDIGIKVKWEPVPPQNTVSAIASKKYPMFLFVEGLTTAAREAVNNFAPGGYLNPFGTKDPELTKLLDRAESEPAPAKSADHYRKVNAYAVKKALDAPVFYVGTNWATKKGIKYLGDGSNTFSTLRAFGASG